MRADNVLEPSKTFWRRRNSLEVVFLLVFLRIFACAMRKIRKKRDLVARWRTETECDADKGGEMSNSRRLKPIV